ncbi:MAG: YfiR/HmsC family protein [Terriglobia bacterium]
MVKSPQPETRRPHAWSWKALRLKICAGLTAGVVLWAAGSAVSSLGAAGASAPSEYAVKAAYLYNFSRFVRWPPADTTADFFRICVLGTDPFGRVLDRVIAGESMDGVRIVARRISLPDEVTGCRILFISSSEAGKLAQILAALSNRDVLTVSDLPEFTDDGGMIGFVLEGNRVRFEVNAATAQRAGLKVSSQVLKLAVKVIKGTAPGGR